MFISKGERLFGQAISRAILSYIHHMTEKNSLIPNMYITQYRLRCRLNQIGFHPSVCIRG
jgi:hypothetical protein